VQFARWWDEALSAGLPRADAVALATADAAGAPSVRMVLLKGVDGRGFVFYTNYDSRKGRELAENPRAGLAFYWAELGRQVRVTGRSARVDAAESDAYFATRPRESQLAAWASTQSAVIPGREVLESEFARRVAEFDGRDVPRPPHWGGYLLEPDVVEFWMNRPGRLHDRVCYTRDGNGWRIERLSP
jgi:pyridoxamine 5'-phosphate oxidase